MRSVYNLISQDVQKLQNRRKVYNQHQFSTARRFPLNEEEWNKEKKKVIDAHVAMMVPLMEGDIEEPPATNTQRNTVTEVQTKMSNYKDTTGRFSNKRKSVITARTEGITSREKTQLSKRSIASGSPGKSPIAGGQDRSMIFIQKLIEDGHTIHFDPRDNEKVMIKPKESRIKFGK